MIETFLYAVAGFLLVWFGSFMFTKRRADLPPAEPETPLSDDLRKTSGSIAAEQRTINEAANPIRNDAPGNDRVRSARAELEKFRDDVAESDADTFDAGGTSNRN